ncbi:MAG: GntR family transcriptional regulator [Planctomycetaceae bacterium]|nr:GntR family transcriptional regulator [Planctomycetaceae bacterium]
MKSKLVYSLREQIANHLRDDVLSGRLAVGARLNEMALVERFGVSRTPIREALQQLTFEGLLESPPNAGARVAPPPPDAIRQLVVPIRQTVETYALRVIFPSLNDADYHNWEAIVEQMRQACVRSDYCKIAEHDIAFHRYIVERAGQKDLEAIWISLIVRMRSHFWETHQRNYGDPMEIYEEHGRLLKVFRSGDLNESIAALEQNIA